MNQPRAYATYNRKGEHIFRTSTYIQWGHSSRSLGSCLLLNPGSATLYRVRPAPNHAIMGEATLDPTMRQLVKITEEIYRNPEVEGRLHIYNLFSLQNPKASAAIEAFERLVETGATALEEHLAPLEDLQKHPWMLLGWGCLKKGRWRHFTDLKQRWLHQISCAGVPTFGKRHSNGKDYYHPSPQLHSLKDAIVRDLVVLYKKAYTKTSS